MASNPWPKDRPVPPTSFATAEKLKKAATEGVSIVLELEHALQSPSTDTKGLAQATLSLVAGLILNSYRPKVAFKFAGEITGVCMLHVKNYSLRRQLDQLYKSYKDANSGGADTDVYGWKEGYLYREISGKLRNENPNLADEELKQLVESSFKAYLENRSYQDCLESYKSQVRAWMKEKEIDWSEDDASFERLLLEIDYFERLIATNKAAQGLYDEQRAKLIQACLRGGKSSLDLALSKYFSEFFDDERDAKGNRSIKIKQPLKVPVATKATAKTISKRIEERLPHLSAQKLDALMLSRDLKLPEGLYDCICKSAHVTTGTGITFHNGKCRCVGPAGGCWDVPLPHDSNTWNFCLSKQRYPDGSTLVDVLTKEVIALRQMRGEQTLQE